MWHRRCLVLAAACLCGTAVGASDKAPEIARISPVGGNEVMQIYGEGFDPKGVDVWAWQPNWDANARDAEAVKKAAQASAGMLGKAPVLPAAPVRGRKGARRLKVIDATSQVVHAITFQPRRPQVTVVWVRNGKGPWSRPYRVNAPEPWWMRPRQAAPGELVTVYGRRMSARNAKVVLRDAKGKAQWADLAIRFHRSYFGNDYVLTFKLPETLARGQYAVFVHNGSGGDHGWVKAETLSVGAPTPSTETVPIDVRTHGAKGDGMADDTRAIEKAMQSAAPKGGTVFFAPGQYRISRCLVVPVGVSLKGAGSGTSMVVVPGGRPLQGRFPAELEEWGKRGEPKDWTPYVPELVPMVWVKSRSRVEDLCLERRAGAGPAVLVSYKGRVAEQISVSHCRIRNLTNTAWVALRFSPNYGGVWVPNKTRGLRVVGNQFFTVGSSLCLLSTARQATIEKNVFRGAEPSHADLFGSRGGFFESLITDNVIQNSKRGMVFQAPYPFRHNYIARNVVEYIDRGGNANETLLLEGGFTNDAPLGVASATPVQLRFNGSSWKPNELVGQAVLVVSGRGFGQYGFVRSNTAREVTLERPWRVVPDRTTQVSIAWMFAETVFHENSDRRSGAAFQFWGGCLANVIDAFISYDAEGVIWWANNSPKHACYCYYNELLNGFIQEMGHLEFRANTYPTKAERLTEAPLVVGNIIRNTALSDYRSRPNNQPGPYWKWYKAWMEPWSAAMFWTSVFTKGRRHGTRQPELWRPDIPPVGAYNLIDGCLFQRGAEGANIMPGWSHTVFHSITMDEVKKPYVDLGEGTVRDR